MKCPRENSGQYPLFCPLGTSTGSWSKSLSAQALSGIREQIWLGFNITVWLLLPPFSKLGFPS